MKIHNGFDSLDTPEFWTAYRLVIAAAKGVSIEDVDIQNLSDAIQIYWDALTNSTTTEKVIEF